ncbi:terminase large subunit [Atopobium fossor]|uniref:terminase large subunit n=1 Tax=Atopobium fossor TaxID=39487 RepID=UPI0004294E15|nr:terminase large subunit [Atopobium fossor]
MVDTEQLTGAELYIQGVLSGEIITSNKVYKLCEIMDKRIKHGYKQWRYDREKATHPEKFIEQFCYIPSGKLGQKFKLELYQKFIIGLIFGFVGADGVREFNEALIIMARKCGKTSLVSAIQQYMLVADGEGAPQVYSIATTEAQAALCYGAAVKMMEQSAVLRKREHTGTIRERKQSGILCDMNKGYITTLSGTPKSLDGLDIHCAVCDELAAWTDRAPYDLIVQGISARAQPLILEITTAGFVRNSIYDSQYEYAEGWLKGEIENDHFLPIIWELDSRTEDWTDESCWIKANPGLGTVKKIEHLRTNVQKAKQDPSFLPTLLTKDFNIPQNEAAAWLTWEECGSEECIDWKEAKFDYGIVGFDASDSIDLTAGTMLCMRKDDDKIYAQHMYWIPSEQLEAYENGNAQRGRDGVPYRLWEAQGLLRVVPGNNIPKSVLNDWIVELRDEMDIYTFAVGVDPWHMDDSTMQQTEYLVGKSRVERVRQGAQTLSDPMKRLRAEYKSGRIVDNNNPIQRWCRMNVAIKRDVNDNIQPVKKGLVPEKRIDGFMSELIAYVVLLKREDEYKNIIS